MGVYRGKSTEGWLWGWGAPIVVRVCVCGLEWGFSLRVLCPDASNW